MNLRIFRSAEGDCLLLEGADGRLLLVDGGIDTSMKAHVAPHLAQLRDDGRKLDAIYVSHIDQDHIQGVLALLETELEWRVYDANQARGEASPEPDVPRPPPVKAIWHNAFHDQVSKNAGPITSQIAASVPVMLATRQPDLTQQALALQAIGLSVKQALQVSRLVKPELLGIPLNAIPGNKTKPKLLVAGKFKPFKIGGMRFTIVGPTADELKVLREEWNDWLRKNPATVRNLRKEMDDNADRVALATRPDSGVTVPNLASLSVMVEEAGRRLLLTGDAGGDRLLDGLRATGFLKGETPLHVDVLKVQHHGASANVKDDFARLVTADHYVFCGDGAHDNPEIDVLQRFFDARWDDGTRRPFTFWFSTKPVRRPASGREEYFRYMAGEAAKLAKWSEGRLTLRFNDGDFVDLGI